MFDIRTVRDDPAAFDADMARRGLAPQAEDLLALDGARRRRIGELEAMRAEHKAAARRIGAARVRGELAKVIAEAFATEEAAALKTRLHEAESDVRAREAALAEAMHGLPNRPAADVPDGADDSANVEIRRGGAPRAFDFAPRPHYEIGEALGQMDFERAAAMSGARFVALQGPLARLHRALGQFMLDLQTGEHGYLEVAPPFMVREQALFGTGQLPKFADDNFVTADGYWLIPTAEVPLTNMARGRVLDEAALPMRLAAHTPCFRAEAGAAGKDTRGMVRLHQFEKVELVSIAAPGGAAGELERMTGCAEEALRRLELPWRAVLLSAGDMGFSARKTYDLEVWLPGQNAWREISSCSDCGDFQARRMNARYRPAAGGAPRFVHTLNGSGLAVGRALVAVVENFQNADGSVTVPDALRPWMGGRARIAAE